MELGPDLFALLNEKQWTGNMAPVIYAQGGLSEAQITAVENQLGFPLPSDFRYLLANMRDPGGVFFPWAQFDINLYRERIEWVRRGILHDVEHCGDWIDSLGERPSPPSAAAGLVATSFPEWPKLLPLHGHRFLPAEPCDAGNPVFSIMQTDIIYYGADLAHYLLNEFSDHNYEKHVSSQNIRHIPFWSDFVR